MLIRAMAALRCLFAVQLCSPLVLRMLLLMGFLSYFICCVEDVVMNNRSYTVDTVQYRDPHTAVQRWGSAFHWILHGFILPLVGDEIIYASVLFICQT